MIVYKKVLCSRLGNGKDLEIMTIDNEVQGWTIFLDRAELYGIHTCIEILSLIVIWKTMNLTVTIYCDNSAAVSFGEDADMGRYAEHGFKVTNTGLDREGFG